MLCIYIYIIYTFKGGEGRRREIHVKRDGRGKSETSGDDERDWKRDGQKNTTTTTL